MSAVISTCGLYRYSLMRHWPKTDDALCDKQLLLWVMLNPSTADSTTDDKTIRRCIGYSKAWGYCGLLVANLYAFRATSPLEMFDAKDPVGPENNRWIDLLPKQAEHIVAAWGGAGNSYHRERVLRRLMDFGTVYCLGTTVDGSPKHPLYLPKNLTPKIYRSAK